MGVPPHPPRETFFFRGDFFSGETVFSAVSGPENSWGGVFFLYVGSVLVILRGTSFKIVPNTQATNKKKIPPGIFFPRGDFFFFVRLPRLPDVAGFYVRRVRLGFPFFGIQNWKNFKLSDCQATRDLVTSATLAFEGLGLEAEKTQALSGPRTPAVFGSH